MQWKNLMLVSSNTFSDLDECKETYQLSCFSNKTRFSHTSAAFTEQVNIRLDIII